MQDSYRQLKEHWSIILVIVLSPLLLYAAIQILPTHDDWAGTTKPDFSAFFTKEHFLFYGYHWRPFDTWIGYIVGRNPQLLYPTFNHVLVIVGHVICSLLVYRLLKTLGFNSTSCNIATFFFFIAPATMATVLAVDSQNQTYALVWGIIAFLNYINNGRWKYFIWPFLIFMATLSKENGLMWALICPILAFGFRFIDKRTLRKDLLIGISIMVVYALAILLLPKYIIIHPEYVPEDLKTVKNIVKFFFSTFITVDYIYLLHQPSRNLLLALITLALSMPFFYYVFVKKFRLMTDRKMICTFIALIIAVGPHIATVFSMMHTYAGLALLSIIIANSIHHYEQLKFLLISFVFFVLSAIFIDTHLWYESWKSGLVGKNMSIEAIQKTGEPVNSVLVIIIEDDYPKLSSFCVIPNEAFGWGMAAQYETNYQWPKIIKDTTIVRSSDAMEKARRMASEMLITDTIDCVWIVNHDKIDVVK